MRDVTQQQRRTKTKKALRLVAIVALFDWFVWRTAPWSFPHLGPNALLFAMPVVLILAVVLMVSLPLVNGRSPHMTIHPAQVEVGLSEVVGLDSQVDEIQRTLDVFLAYASFKDELGGTPRRGILFEGPPGTGKTYVAKAMAKEAQVPFLFIAAPAFQSMWYGMTAFRVRSYFKALRKAARKSGGAIGFIEEIDAIGGSRSFESSVPDGRIARMVAPGGTGMVNELLIQLQSFDTPPTSTRVGRRVIGWLNGYLPSDLQVPNIRPRYNNILLIAATNRADALDSALLRPGRFDRRLQFDPPNSQERVELIRFFLARKANTGDIDPARVAHETFGYTPVMLEHLCDEALLLALKAGRRAFDYDDIIDAKLTEEVGLKQSTTYTDTDRMAVATHEAGHATVAYFLGQDRRLEVLSIIKRRGALGLLAHSDAEERYTKSRPELASSIAIALAGLVAEELFIGDSGTGPAADLMGATNTAAQMVGAFGMEGSLISYEAAAGGVLGGNNLVTKVLSTEDGRDHMNHLLALQRSRALSVLQNHAAVHAALRDALLERDELVRDEIINVIKEALDAEAQAASPV